MIIKKNKILCNILIIILILLLIYIFINLIYINKQNKEINSFLNEQTMVMDNRVLNTNKDTKNEMDYYRNYYSNDDIVGKLKIDGTKINTLLVQGSDNEYYLNHTISKKKSVVGSIFVDYRTNLSDKQINIYGHNSNAVKLMFNELENYKNKDFYEKHKMIELYDGFKISIYEIFSVQIVTDDYEHMDIYSQDRKSHIKKLSDGLYETNVEVSENDDILVLQTCTYTKKNSFIIINAKKVK